MAFDRPLKEVTKFNIAFQLIIYLKRIEIMCSILVYYLILCVQYTGNRKYAENAYGHPWRLLSVHSHANNILNKMPISKTCYYSRSMTLKLKMPHLNLVNVTTHNIQTAANWNWNSNHESLIHFTRIVAHDSKILTSCTLAHCKLIYSRSGM